MKIYRYLKFDRAFEALENLELYAADVRKLNDPFELSPEFSIKSFTDDVIRDMKKQDYHIRGLFDFEGSQRGFTDYEQYRSWYLENFEDRFEQLKDARRQLINTGKKDFAQIFSKDWRLICFSRIRDSIIMWSHYADEHKGVVIEFDTCKEPFYNSNGDVIIVSVKYSKNKPKYIHSHDYKKYENNINNIARSKFTDWKYESEVRIIVPNGILKDNKFLNIPVKSIKSVMCGCRIDPSHRMRLIEMLAKDPFKEIDIYQSSIDEKTYKLNIFKINL